MFPHFPANRLKAVAYISVRRLLRTSWLSLQTTSGQFNISVYDYLRHFCVTSWLIADQQLVPVSFRLRQLPPNLASPHGEVDVFLVFLQSYLQRRSPMIDQQAGGGTVLVTPGGRAQSRACQGAGAVSQGGLGAVIQVLHFSGFRHRGHWLLDDKSTILLSLLL